MCGFVTIELAAAPAEYLALARHLPRLRDKAFILRCTSGMARPLNSAFEAWLDVVVSGLELRAPRC